MDTKRGAELVSDNSIQKVDDALGIRFEHKKIFMMILNHSPTSKPAVQFGPALALGILTATVTKMFS